MELGSCDFAYVRVHRRTGKHRVLEEEEIKRYASEGWIVVPVLSSCLKFNYFFLSVAKFEHALLWARFPRLAWRSRYDLLVLLVYTWRQGGHVGGEEQSLSLLCVNYHVNYSRKPIHHFHIDHNAPCLPPKILHNRELFPISPGRYSRPKRNQRQRLRNFFFFGGGAGEGKQSALWSMWKWWIVLTNNVAALSRGCKPRIKIL